MARGRKKGWFRAALIALAVLTLLPIGGVLIVAVLPPAPTILMLRQAVRGEGLDYQWRGLNDISPNLVNAAIAAEDARFCSHHGFDIEAIQKALDHNAEGGRIRGGSTISQQTAETVWSKRRIMEVYLNVVEWAPGVYGAQAAAQHWFGKDAADLTPREAARLAAILPAPRRYQAAAPGPYVRRRASRIQAAMGTVRTQNLNACVFR